MHLDLPQSHAHPTVRDEFLPDNASKSLSPSADPSRPSRTIDIVVMSLVAVFYTCIVGNERIFLSMQFTFGLCGPLHLDPAEAVITDKVYTGGFMVGR